MNLSEKERLVQIIRGLTENVAELPDTIDALIRGAAASAYQDDRDSAERLLILAQQCIHYERCVYKEKIAALSDPKEG